MKKMPPIEKIYEAYSAIADNRVVLKENSASVYSSDRSKEYKVTWKEGLYISNDNASYWQGICSLSYYSCFNVTGEIGP